MVRAHVNEHPDLLWALRGGGGNYGVVTESQFALHPVGPLVHVAMLFWELEHSAPALHIAHDVSVTLARDAGMLIAGPNAAPEPFVPPEHHFAPGVASPSSSGSATPRHTTVASPTSAHSWHRRSSSCRTCPTSSCSR